MLLDTTCIASAVCSPVFYKDTNQFSTYGGF